MTSITTCAALSKAVYSLTVPEGLHITGFERIWDESTQTLGCCYITPNALVFAFRGSVNKRHWLSNFRIIKTDYHGIKAHRGFAESAQSVLEQVLQLIEDYGPTRRIVFTGHSLGGAIAVLLAAAGRPRPIEVITFGQPRVSRRRHLENAMQGSYLRIVNGSDAVPRKPWLGYSHGGCLMYLTNDGRRLANPSWWAMFKDRVWMTWQHQRLTDHYMNDYIEELEVCGIS